MKKWKETMQPYMIRPAVYMTFTRLVLIVTAILLIDFFVSDRDLRQPLFGLGFLLCAVLAWIAYLRMDGIHLPKLLMLRINPRKKPSRMTGDMIDYVDEQPMVAFEDLDDEEKDLCILIADLVCALVCLVAGILL